MITLARTLGPLAQNRGKRGFDPLLDVVSIYEFWRGSDIAGSDGAAITTWTGAKNSRALTTGGTGGTLRVSGSNRWLDFVPTNTLAYTIPVAQSQSVTVFTIAKISTTTAVDIPFIRASFALFTMSFALSTANLTIYAQTSPVGRAAGAGIWIAGSGIFNGASSSVRVNGSASSGTTGTQSMNGVLNVGAFAGSSFTVSIAALLIKNGTATSDELLGWEAYAKGFTG